MLEQPTCWLAKEAEADETLSIKEESAWTGTLIFHKYSH